jgi:hypothetical protein
MINEENGAVSLVGLPATFIIALLPLSTPLRSACRCRSTKQDHPVCAIYASAVTLFDGIVKKTQALPIPDLLDISYVSEAANHFEWILVLSLIARAPPS